MTHPSDTPPNNPTGHAGIHHPTATPPMANTMNDPNTPKPAIRPMQTHELFELAQLHALALLDDDEQAAFEAALDQASPGVREQVRLEQERLGAIEAMLPDVAPAASLAGKVRDAIQLEREKRAAANLRLVDDGNTLIPSRQVSPIWRASALGLAAASVVFCLTTVFMWGQHRELDRVIRNDALLAAMVQSFGSEYVQDALFDPDTQRVVLVSQQEGVDAQAALWSNPSWGASRLFCLNLPGTAAHEPFKLVALDASDNIVATLGEFTSTGALITNEVDLAPGSATRIAIVPMAATDAAANILLATAPGITNQL